MMNFASVSQSWRYAFNSTLVINLGTLSWKVIATPKTRKITGPVLTSYVIGLITVFGAILTEITVFVWESDGK